MTVNQERSFKIFVVEDNLVITKLMVDFLEGEGHEVITAASGIEALDCLEHFHPEIIFLDLIMKNIPGDKLCKIIRTKPQFDDTFVVILSGLAAEQAIDYKALGADLCIAKGPFKSTSQDVLTAIRRAGAGRQAERDCEILGLDSVHSRRMTRELLNVKNHYELILNSIFDGIFELNAKTGVMELNSENRILYVNHEATLLFGKSEEELLSQSFTDHLLENDYNRFRQKLSTINNTDPIKIGEEEPLQLKDRLYTLAVIPFLDHDEKSFVVILHDVTEQKIAEKKLQKTLDTLEHRVNDRTLELARTNEILTREIHERKILESQLIQSHKMAAIGELAGGIAHNFNNILAVILGNAEMAQDEVPESSSVKICIDEIVKAGKRARDLVSQILTFSRKGGTEKNLVHFKPLIMKSISLLRASFPATVAISHEINPSYDFVYVDSGQIHQLLINICTNAVQAMDDKGVLTIRMDNVLSGEDCVPATLKKPNQEYFIRLSVIDTGHGMDCSVVERIFEPFFTTKDIGEGIGMGLSVAHGIVKSHEGMISVESEPGKGTSIHLFFPVAEMEEELRVITSSGDLLKGSGKILFVDDEEMIGSYIKRRMESLGYSVTVRTDSHDALKIFRDRSEGFDLVITDLTMPEMTGIELAEKLLEIRPDIPVIMCSGFSSKNLEDTAKAIGIREFFVKPVDMSRLDEVINKIMAEKPI